LPFAASSPTVPSSGLGSGPTPPPVASPAPSTVPATLVVHVAGAVVAPGVYELAGGARTADAVAAAGGATTGSDVDALNLAAPLRDGERVYVPVEGEAPPPLALPPGDAPGSSVAPGPVDLNRATAAELDALPGIGPATAQAIVAHREANGPFASIDDLEQVRGIGPAKLATIRPLVTL
jgi:competence protein ComEA